MPVRVSNRRRGRVLRRQAGPRRDPARGAAM